MGWKEDGSRERGEREGRKEGRTSVVGPACEEEPRSDDSQPDDVRVARV